MEHGHLLARRDCGERPTPDPRYHRRGSHRFAIGGAAAKAVHAETASLQVECLERAGGDELVARATTIKSGRKLIRLRVDVFVRSGTRETLVGIAQVNMSPARAEERRDEL